MTLASNIILMRSIDIGHNPQGGLLVHLYFSIWDKFICRTEVMTIELHLSIDVFPIEN